MTFAQERTNLAVKIFLAGEVMQKMLSRNRWFLDTSKEADLKIHNDLSENNLNRSEKAEVRKAKVSLHQLLSKPMKIQRFGKFLSTNSAIPLSEINHPLAVKAL
jgi:hypothetical protein